MRIFCVCFMCNRKTHIKHKSTSNMWFHEMKFHENGVIKLKLLIKICLIIILTSSTNIPWSLFLNDIYLNTVHLVDAQQMESSWSICCQFHPGRYLRWLLLFLPEVTNTSMSDSQISLASHRNGALRSLVWHAAGTWERWKRGAWESIQCWDSWCCESSWAKDKMSG